MEKNGGSDWRTLYGIGGVSALLMAAIALSQFVVFAAAPPPLEGNAGDWFALFQKNEFLGLLAFEFSLVIYAVLAIPTALALYVTFRQADQSLAALFLTFSIVGSVCFVLARPALEMLFLSRQYVAAASDVQRAAYLAAGEQAVATFDGTSFQVSYILGSISGILLSIAMLKRALFGKTIAYLRLASSILDFGIFIPAVGLFISLGSVVCLLAFNILAGVKLLKAARVRSEASAGNQAPAFGAVIGE